MQTKPRLILSGVLVAIAGTFLVINPTATAPAATPSAAAPALRTTTSAPAAAPVAKPPADPCASGWCERKIRTPDRTGAFSFNQAEGAWTSPFPLLAGEKICSKSVPALPGDLLQRGELETLLSHKTGPIMLGSSGHASFYFRSPVETPPGAECKPLS